MIPEDIALREQDPEDGVSAFTLIGYSEDASIISLLVNTAPALGGVAVEHTHPPQTYLFPYDPSEQRRVKTAARAEWRSILSAAKED